MKILDCTLRDGGYYNNWDFKPKLVKNYIKAMLNANIDLIEIGFRFLNKSEYYGPYAYSTDEFISKLDIPKSIKIGVMLNFSDILNSTDSVVKTIDSIFVKKNNSPVYLVRIAAHVDDVLKVEETAIYLKKLGYTVGLNIMQANNCSIEEFENISKNIFNWDAVDILYFADSMGNMQSKDIIRTINALKSYWPGPIGLHAHDNMGQSEQNVLVAIDNGATWIDSTVMGMGRGAGNLKTENLLLKMQQKNLGEYKAEALFEIVTTEFKELMEKYNWGENVFYYLGAMYNIHPSYIQEMQSSTSYSTTDKVGVLKYLYINGGKSFSKKALHKAVVANSTSSEGEWDCTDWTNGRDVLLVAGSSSLAQYIDEVQDFITRKSPIVISLNYIELLGEDYIDIYASCYLTKIVSQLDNLSKINKPLLVPINALPDNIKSKFSSKEIYNYGMFIEENILNSTNSHCTIPNPLVFTYAISTLSQTDTKKIYMVGFDGYSNGDYRNDDMEQAIELFKNTNNGVRLISLMPTIYNVEKNSIYNPHI